MRRNALLFLLLFAAFASRSQQPPNVIIILTDDQGYHDVGFNGCEDIPTPHIDRIAEEGVVFTQGYVSFPVCGPSRAGLITGRYQDRFGFCRNPLLAPRDSLMGLPLSEQTLATALQPAGYRSLALGKWHLGAHPSLWPRQRGFDEFFGFLSGGHDYFPEKWTLQDLADVRDQWDGYRTRLMRNEGRVDEAEYLTDALSREAVEFIAREDSGQPFFMYLAYNAPHTPMQATEKYLQRFAHIADPTRRTYAAMVSAVDDGVGNILAQLETSGLRENTLIFFLSDNGGSPQNASDNAPLRGHKGQLFEGGIRVPFAACWPGQIPAGLRYEQPVISLDIFATVLAAAGLAADPDRPLDGVDLLPYLQGEETGRPHAALFWRKEGRPQYAIRAGDQKLVKEGDHLPYLFDLADDLAETNNLASQQPDQQEQLQQQHDQWVAELKDPVFMGLLEDKAYSEAHPERYQLQSSYRPDTTAAPQRPGYELVWQDEFDQPGRPEPAHWSYEQGFRRNQELQWYQPENAFVENEVLVIEGRREEVLNPDYDPDSRDWRKQRKTAHYTASSLVSRGKFSFQYGILEVRARLDTALGMWPAIWTLGVDQRWPACGEVDLMEYYRVDGRPTILANAAWAREQPGPEWDGAKVPYAHVAERVPDWDQRFHLWRMEWEPDEMRLYLDDELLNTIDLTQTVNPDGSNPFHQPHSLLLNLAIGANGGDPSGTTFPRRYEVDYVRVYQRK